MRSSIKYLRTTFRKTNISNFLIGKRTCAYQGLRNISFSENFAYVLNGWPLWRDRKLAEYAACLLYWIIYDWKLSIYKNSPTAILCGILEFDNFPKEIRHCQEKFLVNFRRISKKLNRDPKVQFL